MLQLLNTHFHRDEKVVTWDENVHLTTQFY